MVRGMTSQTSSNASLFSLHGQVALVTGASRGIGAATAKQLAAQGAVVGVNYVSSEARAQSVVAEIKAAGGRALAVRGSVGDPAEVAAMVRQVEEGLGPITLLVCNADAVREFTVKPALKMSWAEYEDLLTGETKAVFYPVQAVAPGMIERGGGTIINVSSGLARTPQPGMAGHSSGKAALEALTRALALELGPQNVRVNAVAPGLVETEASAWTEAGGGGVSLATTLRQITPLRRIATPEDIAGAIVLLVSGAAGFVNGMTLDVNGGLTMR